MGEYIQAGICYSVKISKRYLKDSDISFVEILEELGKQIPINLYIVDETENNYVWNLKGEVLEKGQLPEFLTEQYKLFNAYQVEEIFAELKDLSKSKDIIEFAKEKRYESFQSLSSYSFIYCGTWEKEIKIEYNLIVFFLAGKIVMEAYRRFLRYMETLIKKDNVYKISEAVKVLIG